MSRSHRGTVLLTVLVVVAMSAIAGTGAVLLASMERAGAESSMRRTRARALAWSGVQGAMAELGGQREELLAGGPPRLTPEWTLFDDDGRVGVVRLIAHEDGAPAMSETAKLDVNSATREMLSRVPGLEPAQVDAIVASRGAAPIGSVEELAALGVDLDARSGSDEEASPSLRDLLTVFSFDPNVQSGVGDNGDRFKGRLRVNLNTEWSDRIERAVARRYNDDVAKLVKAIFEQGSTFKSDADLIKVLRKFSVKPEDWAETLDVFTTTDDQFRLGRVDVSRARAEVLACIPGFTAEKARHAVDVRERLDATSLASPTWLVLEDVLTEDEFELAVDHVTTRSTQWRVVVEAGLRSAEDDDAPLTERIVVEAVIDVASQRPRVAWMRDATALESVVAVRDMMAPDPAEHGPDETSGPDRPLDNDDEPATPDVGAPSDGLNQPPSSARSDGASRAERAASPREAPRSRAGTRSERRSSSDSAGVQPPAPTRPEIGGGEEDADSGVSRDRRIGRWTRGGAS